MATETYRYTSNKNDWDQTERLILEGSSTNPERYVDLGGEIEMDDQEYEKFSKRHRLTKVDDQTRTAQGTDVPGGEGSGETPDKPEDKRPAGRARRGGTDN